MRYRLGQDFSHVRVHTDDRANESADSVGALAYTVGSKIVFAAGRYAPSLPAGRRLLVHELAHVMQQQCGEGMPGGDAVVEDARLEGEADQLAGQVLAAPTGLAAAAERRATVARSSTSDLLRSVIQRAAADAGTPAAAGPVDAGTPAATAACALRTYTGSNFVGDAVVADVEFVDSLDSINTHAVANDVNVHVTSSFRTSTVVPGAIVTPATMSNHLAGHAIDMNVKYGPGKAQWCNSTCLGGTLSGAVKGFIDAVRADAGLRWGGDFKDTDPVHIDDGLNVNDPDGFKERHKATQDARTSGCG
jgi:hypothetical protein